MCAAMGSVCSCVCAAMGSCVCAAMGSVCSCVCAAMGSCVCAAMGSCVCVLPWVVVYVCCHG